MKKKSEKEGHGVAQSSIKTFLPPLYIYQCDVAIWKPSVNKVNNIGVEVRTDKRTS